MKKRAVARPAKPLVKPVDPETWHLSVGCLDDEVWWSSYRSPDYDHGGQVDAGLEDGEEHVGRDHHGDISSCNIKS